jgi:hypothetical protein
MSDNPLETTATEALPSNPVPASTPAPSVDVEAIRKAAAAEARREAQSKHDQQTARLHKEYQARERELKAAASARLGKAGYDDPDTIFRDVEVLQKARQYDELSAQAQQAAEWDNYVEGLATAYGLAPSDPRLAGAGSAQELKSKANAAMLEDAAKEREKAVKEARAAAVARAEAKVDNGDLDTLGGAPPAGSPSLEERYKKEMLAAKGQGARKGREIREKYRAQGVDVDYIPLR